MWKIRTPTDSSTQTFTWNIIVYSKAFYIIFIQRLKFVPLLRYLHVRRSIFVTDPSFHIFTTLHFILSNKYITYMTIIYFNTIGLYCI